MEPKKYCVNLENVTYTKLIQSGFRMKDEYFIRTYPLCNNFIKLVLMIDLGDYFLSTSVVDDSGNLYAPFYNPDEHPNNLVAEQVVKKYNGVMDKLVQKGILTEITGEKKESEIKACKSQSIKIKYISEKIEKIGKIGGSEKSDWIDLRAAEDVKMKKGDFKLIPLGVAMELPAGYEAHVVPRSSTFKNFGVIQTNHMGVIDESYCGDNDQWYMPVLAVRDTEIHVNDRICQFRIIKKMDEIILEEVEELNNKNRGGLGSTGKR